MGEYNQPSAECMHVLAVGRGRNNSLQAYTEHSNTMSASGPLVGAPAPSPDKNVLHGLLFDRQHTLICYYAQIVAIPMECILRQDITTAILYCTKAISGWSTYVVRSTAESP
jgi:hypothetical protein